MIATPAGATADRAAILRGLYTQRRAGIDGGRTAVLELRIRCHGSPPEAAHLPSRMTWGAEDERHLRRAWLGLAVTPARPRASAGADAVLRRPVAPMLAAPVDAVPEGADLVHEPKWDGWRAIAFRETDGVYLQSRAGRNLTTYFPDITRAVRAAIPPGVVFDGELIVFERGRTNFAQLQRRVTAGRDLLRAAHECPAHYVLFDLLADASGQVIIDLPLSERRARLERLLADPRRSSP